MCGRFAITLPHDAVAQIFDARPANDLPETPNYNVCPTNQVHVVLAGEDGRRLTAMRWGFLPHWYKTPSDGPLLINTLAETLAEKPAFRAASRERRCLIPATGFYEWTKDAEDKRLPWYIHPAEGGVIAFAGIWQDWTPKAGGDTLTTCAIVTTAANAAMSAIHHRMPVSLAPAEWGLWLGEQGKGAATLMRPGPEDRFVWHRVDPQVNSNRARGAHLIDPAAA
jgi:putative SOS response-associated peptidase YedK